jgi:hypothetical protein
VLQRFTESLDRIRWGAYFGGGRELDAGGAGGDVPLLPPPDEGRALPAALKAILAQALALHDAISDGFLNHQEMIGRTAQSSLPALVDVL